MAIIQTQIATAVDTYDFQGNRRMAKASNGRLWIIYRDKANGTQDIKVAYSDDNGATWTSETVKVGVETVNSHALAIDSNNDVHIVWSERKFGPMEVWLYYRKRTSGSWGSIVELYNDSGTFTSPLYPDIAVDGNDDVHVVYVDYSGTAWRLKYVKYSSGSWGAHTVLVTGAASGDNIEEPSLAIDSSDYPHITYDHRVSTNYRVDYIHETSGGWQSVEMVSSDDVGTFPHSQIALDSGNDVHAVWGTYGVGTYTGKIQTAYRKRASGSWESPEYLTDVDNDQGYACISLNSNDTIHVIWMGKGWGINTGEWTIQHKSKIGDTWSNQDDLVNEAKYNYPATSLWARYPTQNTLGRGYAFIYVSENTLSDLEFYADTELIPEGSGVIAVVEERFHYVDAYGQERYIQGELVV